MLSSLGNAHSNFIRISTLFPCIVHCSHDVRIGRTRLHTLVAELSGTEMRVFVDDGLVWEGSVGPEALDLEGPVGVRSDNARLQIELRAAQPRKSQPGEAAGCRSGAADSD